MYSDFFNSTAEAIGAAVYRDLPAKKYWARDWAAYRRLPKAEQQKLRHGDGPGRELSRRPQFSEIGVVVFPQTWGSTALGYGGVGGAAMTTAYTVVCSDGINHCIYFGCGRLAYSININDLDHDGRINFTKDIADHCMADCADAHSRYSKVRTPDGR